MNPPLLHVAFTREDIGKWLFFLIPAVAMAVGLSLIVRTAHWSETHRPTPPRAHHGDEPIRDSS
jgi:hypothetical protein